MVFPQVFICLLINLYSEKNKDLKQFNKNLENFIERIKKYPKEKSEKIKKFTKLYIQYSYYILDDLANSMKKYLESRTYSFHESYRTTEIKSKMATFVSKDFMTTLEEQMKMVLKEINGNIQKSKEDETEIKKYRGFHLILIESNELVKSNSKYLFKKIFKEDFNEM